eukprot:CAMPEP_0198500008 /NCGR_PEP_ID=MMETSP1462-20131121/7944_1 /TAXON_ID=1333877 /ORGANISM="Brandtodinium nutriculum, Strain RCC3387" /LENGTH=375 /DNA_ID=CAMNT_0044229011 /DNA_START=58 /DNA_END=1185 /DNA_ORIENTATION=-
MQALRLMLARIMQALRWMLAWIMQALRWMWARIMQALRLMQAWTMQALRLMRACIMSASRMALSLIMQAWLLMQAAFGWTRHQFGEAWRSLQAAFGRARDQVAESVTEETARKMVFLQVVTVLMCGVIAAIAFQATYSEGSDTCDAKPMAMPDWFIGVCAANSTAVVILVSMAWFTLTILDTLMSIHRWSIHRRSAQREVEGGARGAGAGQASDPAADAAADEESPGGRDIDPEPQESPWGCPEFKKKQALIRRCSAWIVVFTLTLAVILAFVCIWTIVGFASVHDSTSEANEATCPVTWHWWVVVVLTYANAFWCLGDVVRSFSCLSKRPVREGLVQEPTLPVEIACQVEQSEGGVGQVEEVVQKPEDSLRVAL